MATFEGWTGAGMIAVGSALVLAGGVTVGLTTIPGVILILAAFGLEDEA